MRRKLVIICMAACMLCLAIGCGTGKENNVADESTSATNNNSSAELKKTDAVSEPVAFAYCEALSGVEFKGSALKVGSDAFYDYLDELTILYKGVKYNKQSIEDAV